MNSFLNKRKASKMFLLLGGAAGSCFLAFFLSASAHAAAQIGSRLLYDRQNSGAVPIPPSEKTLQTVAATAYYQVTKENHFLSGSVFDKEGNLFFCDWTDRKVLRLTPERQISLIAEFRKYHPSGLSFGPDGRLYIAAYAADKEEGGIYAVKREGGALETIIDPRAGFVPKNLFFNRSRGFYFTDFKGTPSHADGGVYYVFPDLKTVHNVAAHFALPNGVMLSPDQKILWVTETGKNALHRIELETPTQLKIRAWTIPYYFTGPPPESISGGSDGNVYVALKGQGRVLILNRNGLPIGQILISGRTKGHNLLSSTVAIQPEAKNLYILSSDGDHGWGAGIFKQTSFGHGVNFQNFDLLSAAD